VFAVAAQLDPEGRKEGRKPGWENCCGSGRRQDWTSSAVVPW